MRNTSAILVDLNEVVTFYLNPPGLSFSPYLPGFLRDRLALSGKLIGFVWPSEIQESFEWEKKAEFLSWVSSKLVEEKAPVFPIICLEDREDPKPLWDLRGKLNLSLWGSRYFTGESSCRKFARDAGVSYFAFFPFNVGA